MIRAVDMGSVFALARYAAEKAKPLVDQVPGGSLEVHAHIEDKWFSIPWSVSIYIHRTLNAGTQGKALAPMVIQESHLVTTADVDSKIQALREIVEHQSWPLDDSEQAAA